MFDSKKFSDYNLITYNLLEYHRQLAANNANLANSNANPNNTHEPLNPIFIGLTTGLPNALSNLPQSTLMNASNLAAFPNASSNQVPINLPNALSNGLPIHPTGLIATNIPPNLLIAPTELLNQSIANQATMAFSSSSNPVLSNNLCCKCKCSTGSSDSTYTMNTMNSTPKQTSTGTIESNFSLASLESTNGRMYDLSEDHCTAIASSDNNNRTPRALRKTNDIFIKEQGTKTFETELNQRMAKMDIDSLLTKLVDRTEKVFKKYYDVPEKKAKLYHSRKSVVHQTLKPVQSKDRVCFFCKNNGEPDYLYKTHIVRDPITNKTLCPVLRNYKCELCSATGDEAHTRSYCPLSKFIRENCENVEAARFFNMRILTSQHRKKQYLLEKIDQEIKQRKTATELSNLTANSDENKENLMVLNGTQYV